jgi:hypothetical protein
VACDVALLNLARTLRERGHEWHPYAAAAERNLLEFVLSKLWRPEQRLFGNTVDDAGFVPNKAATTVEALFAWAEFVGRSDITEEYVAPTLDAIVASQVRDRDSAHDGAIPQRVETVPGGARFFPFYIARCLPALVEGYRKLEEPRYLEAAELALAYILRQQLPDGSFPQVLYDHGRVNRYPRWIAGVAEILRAAEDVAAATDKEADHRLAKTREWLLDGQLHAGGFRTAAGFASQVSQRPPPDTPDFADLLPVCGWNSMVFRYLSRHVNGAVLGEARRVAPRSVDEACLFRGRRARYQEDSSVLKARRKDQTVYCWRKGTRWATIC